MEKDKVMDLWDEVKTLVESMELDIHKAANGNKSAGVRARRGLRLLKSKSHDLVKTTLGKE